jgi:hypothetical protein
MRFKTIVVLLLFVAAIGIVVMATPASAAKPSDSITKQGPDGYLITISKVSPDMMFAMSGWYSISQGQYMWHGTNINYYTESRQTYLYWGNPSNSLRLRIFSPEGHVFGPFYDSSDGIVNGAILVQISRPGGIAQGTWVDEVYGYRVTGVQSYNI